MQDQAFPQKLRTLRVCSFVIALSAALNLLGANTAAAQPQPAAASEASASVLPNASQVPVKNAPPPKAPPRRLAWKELSPAQQQALKPLAAHWETLGYDRKRKWLALSKNYPSMSPDEQAKLHSRMNEWVTLSQLERTQARLNFVETQKLSPKERAARWRAYQELSPDEKRELAAKAPSRPAGTAVVRPLLPKNLTYVPVTRKTPKADTQGTAIPSAINRHTLLPQPPAAIEPAPAPKG